MESIMTGNVSNNNSTPSTQNLSFGPKWGSDEQTNQKSAQKEQTVSIFAKIDTNHVNTPTLVSTVDAKEAESTIKKDGGYQNAFNNLQDQKNNAAVYAKKFFDNISANFNFKTISYAVGQGTDSNATSSQDSEVASGINDQINQ